MECQACTTCSSEPVFSAMSTAARRANSASSEPSVASRIFVGKMFIYLPFPIFREPHRLVARPSRAWATRHRLLIRRTAYERAHEVTHREDARDPVHVHHHYVLKTSLSHRLGCLAQGPVRSREGPARGKMVGHALGVGILSRCDRVEDLARADHPGGASCLGGLNHRRTDASLAHLSGRLSQRVL